MKYIILIFLSIGIAQADLLDEVMEYGRAAQEDYPTPPKIDYGRPTLPPIRPITPIKPIIPIGAKDCEYLLVNNVYQWVCW